jgi:hypothetical protein
MPKQAGRSILPATSTLQVSALLKFDLKLPVYSIDAYLCGLLKESPMVLPVLFSKGETFTTLPTSNQALYKKDRS